MKEPGARFVEEAGCSLGPVYTGVEEIKISYSYWNSRPEPSSPSESLYPLPLPPPHRSIGDPESLWIVLGLLSKWPPCRNAKDCRENSAWCGLSGSIWTVDHWFSFVIYLLFCSSSLHSVKWTSVIMMMVDLSYYPGNFLWMKYTFLVLWLGKVHDSLPEHEMFTNLTLKSQLNVLWNLYRKR